MVDSALASQLDLAEGVPLQPNARYAIEPPVRGADLAADGSVQCYPGASARSRSRFLRPDDQLFGRFVFEDRWAQPGSRIVVFRRYYFGSSEVVRAGLRMEIGEMD